MKRPIENYFNRQKENKIAEVLKKFNKISFQKLSKKQKLIIDDFEG